MSASIQGSGTIRAKLNESVAFVVPRLLFFLPRDRRTRIERWLRGREELRKLYAADIALVSWGKSGRTWLRLMLSRFYQTRFGLPPSANLEFDNLKQLDPAIPSVFFTHGNYLRNYTGNWDNLRNFYGKKIVFLARDPRDVAVSQYFQWKFRMLPIKKILNAYPPDGAELSVWDFVMGHDAGLKRIVGFFNLWAGEMPRMKEIHLVRYEDLRADPEGVLKEVLTFMGTAPSDAEAKEAVAFAAYDNMKKLESKQAVRWSGQRLRPGDQDNPDSFKVRRAKVGGYRDYFTDDQVAAIDAYVEENLAPIYRYSEQVDNRAASAE